MRFDCFGLQEKINDKKYCDKYCSPCVQDCCADLTMKNLYIDKMNYKGGKP